MPNPIFYLLTMATSILPFLDILNESNSGCNSTHPDVEAKFFAALLSCPSLAHNVANRCNAFTSSNKKAWRTVHLAPMLMPGAIWMLMPGAIWKNSPSKRKCSLKRKDIRDAELFNHLPKNIEKHPPLQEATTSTWESPAVGEQSLPSTAAPIFRT